MNGRFRKIVPIFLIVCLAFLLRFFQLGNVPSGINLDEAAIGYNAYSILKTGKDEYGDFFPLTFRSLDDYKPPLYIYLTVPSVWVFDLTEFAVRFPSAILGVLAVISTYFLVREMFGRNYSGAPEIAAFLLAISPWHLQFTRTAYETGSAALFTSLGALFFLKGLKKNVYLPLSAFFFGAELYLYQATKVFVPLIILSLCVIYREQLKTKFKWAVTYLILFALFLGPIILLSTTVAGTIRFQGTSIFQNVDPHNRTIAWKVADWLRNDRISATVFHPQLTSYSEEVLLGYFSHFRLDFLFLGLGGPKVSFVPNIGLLSLWTLPFLLVGFVALYGARGKRPAWLLLSWLLLAPLPASVTLMLPSSIRTAIFLPSFQIITAVGITYVLGVVSRSGLWKRATLIVVLVPVAIYFFAYYLHMYYVHAPIEYSQKWYYSYREAFEYAAKMGKNYNRVIVSNSLDQPLNFFQFFLKYDPKRYQDVDGGTIAGGFAEERNHFDKFYFHRFKWEEVEDLSSTLLVGSPPDFPPSVRPLKVFHYLSGEPSVLIVESRR